MAHALTQNRSLRVNRGPIPTRVPQSPTPRSIVPSDVPPASPSGRQRSIHRAGSFDEREDHKAALTKQYSTTKRLEEDGYVPPSEVDSETRLRRRRAKRRGTTRRTRFVWLDLSERASA